MNPLAEWMRFCALLLGMLFSASLLAQAYPLRAIRVIVPFAPGGATDAVARLVAQKMGEALGQPVEVENRSGAAGTVGADAVAKSPADGYTLLIGTTSTHALGPLLNPTLPYSQLDFAPVTLVASFPHVLVAHPSLGRSLPELIALLKANPGKYSFGSAGAGTPTHFAGELFKQMAPAEVAHVAYHGGAPLLEALSAGQVAFAFDQISAVLPAVQAGRVRALGVASLERVAALPDVPAIGEVLPGFEATAWVGLFAPARTPPEITSRLQAQVRAAVQLSEVAQRMRELGATPAALSPDAFATFIAGDTEKWRAVAANAGIKIGQ